MEHELYRQEEGLYPREVRKRERGEEKGEFRVSKYLQNPNIQWKHSSYLTTPLGTVPIDDFKNTFSKFSLIGMKT